MIRSWMVALALSGCAADTGSQRFVFDAFAGGRADAAAPLTFTNARGWTVTLTRADVTLGPIYLNVAAPLRSARGPLDWLLPLAIAQEEHLAEGRVVGEVLGQVRFSALSAELVPFAVPGDTTREAVRTAEVWFYPEPGVPPEATNIAGAALEVEGTAVRDGAALAFRGALVLDDDWLSEQPAGTRGSTSITELRQVRGIEAAFVPSPGGHLELRMDASALFRGADFASLADSPVEPDGTTRLVQERATRDQVMGNLYQGLRAADGTYALRWVDP